MLLPHWKLLFLFQNGCIYEALSLGELKPPHALFSLASQIARFMRPTWGPPGSCCPQVGPMLAAWTLQTGLIFMIIMTKAILPAKLHFYQKIV